MSLWYNIFTDTGFVPLKVNFQKKRLSCSRGSKVWHCKGPNRYSLSQLENGLSSAGGVTLRQEGHPVRGGHSLINSNPYSLLASPEPSLPQETSGYGTLHVNFSALSLFPPSACPPPWITSQALPQCPPVPLTSTVSIVGPTKTRPRMNPCQASVLRLLTWGWEIAGRISPLYTFIFSTLAETSLLHSLQQNF